MRFTSLPSDALNSKVFINCPFDPDFLEVFRAVIFCIKACGFQPLTAQDESDSGRSRIDKITSLIVESDWNVHDLSAVELDKATKLPRFNMPLELGIALGIKWKGAGKRQRFKRILVLDSKSHQYDASTSDLSGQDIRAHDKDPVRAISCVRDWLAQDRDPSLPHLPGGKALAADYSKVRVIIDGLIAKHRLDPWRDLSHPDYLRCVDYGLLILSCASVA